MSIILIRPMTPPTSSSGLVSIQYPINIGYLVSYLEQHKIGCAVLDFEVNDFSEESFLASIAERKPSVVGISCMTPHIIHGGTLARLVKEHFPDILTVLGGVHVSAIPEQTLREFPHFDVAVVGEGERTLLELYKSWTESKKVVDIPGTACRVGNSVRVNSPREMIQDINEVPFPSRDFIEPEKYKKSHVSRGFSRKTMNIVEITCSRGCPYDCIFCASKVVHTRNVRFRTPENIISEMELLITKYNAQHFSFLDDTFTIRKRILVPVCEYMKSRNVTFDCFTRVNDIDYEKMAVMIAGGCKKISFGIESGSRKILKLIKKGITLEQVEKAFVIARKAGLELIEGTFMVGNHPNETLEDIELTKKLIWRLNPDIMAIFITIPYPGTEINRILKEKKLLVKENWEEFTLFFGEPSWQLGEVPMEDLIAITKKIFYSYYMRPCYIVSQILKIRSFKDVKYWFELGLSFIKTKYDSLNKK